MHAVIYSCLVDFVKSELGSFTHEIFSVDSHIHRDIYFSIRSLLRTMCLVSSRWRYLAQRALQHRIVLRSRRGVLSFEKNCQPGPWIRELYLEPVVVKPFEEEYQISSDSDSGFSSDTSSDEYSFAPIHSGYETVEVQAKNNACFLDMLVHVSERLIPKLSNIRCLGISMHHYLPNRDINGCILDFIDALQYVPHLRGLFLIDPNTRYESRTEPFLVPLCHRIAQLPSLSHLWICNFGVKEPVANEELPSALRRIKPPPRLKFVGFEVPDARFRHAVLSWLVAARDNCTTPECIVASAYDGRSLANSDLLRMFEHPCAVTRLHLDFASFGNSQATVDLVSSILPSLTSLRDLYIGYGLMVRLRVLLPNLSRLRLEFLYPNHSKLHTYGLTHGSIFDVVSSGYFPNLRRVTFCVLFSTEFAEFEDLLKPDENPAIVALRNQFGIECDFELTEISAQRRLLADSIGCPS